MEPNFREQVKRNNEAIMSATFKKGIVAGVHIENATLDVIIAGPNQSLLKGLPISTSINIYDVQVNDRCRIDMFDESNPFDSVVSYTYGRSSKGLLVFANNAAAVAGGLVRGQFYRTGGDPDAVCVVH